MVIQITNGDGAAIVFALNCIDLSSTDTNQSVSLLKQACLDCVFFYLVNHGIGEVFMAEMFDQSRRLFGLPMIAKMEFLRNKNYRGYAPSLDQHLGHENQVHALFSRISLDIHFFNKPEMLGEAIGTLGLLHYDGQVSDPANGIFGAGAHSDFGFVTLLATDDVVGLQVRRLL